VWPARNPHPAAARFATVAGEVLQPRPGRPDRIVGAPGPWSVVYNEPAAAAGDEAVTAASPGGGT
jgi:hypothetical protein